MSIAKGQSGYFSKLDEIEIKDFQIRQFFKEDPTILENKLGNRILYPQTVPLGGEDLLFNSVIIRKIIELNLTKIYNKNLRKIDIPEEFLKFIPNLKSLLGIFIDTIKPNGITTLSFKTDQYGSKSAGTLIRPDNLQKGSFITIGIKGQQYQIEAGSLVMIPISDGRVDITFTSTSAKLMGKKILAAQIIAGKLGLIIDARI